MTMKGEDLIGSVRQALAHDPMIDAPKISITFLGDQITLSGLVDDPAQAERAEQLARQAAPGVPVENGLTVGGGTPHVLNDTTLGQRASEALERAREQIRSRPVSVSVEVTHGLARLHGSCSTAADRQFLIQSVARVEGIRDLTADDFEVAPFGSADDIRLGNLAFERMQELAPDLANVVAVTVKNRSAHLTGRVRGGRDKCRAEQAVMQVPGIKHIHNELELYQAEERSQGDAKLEQRVRHALGDAKLAVPDVYVFATGDLVHLGGQVGSLESKRAIELCARGVPGVTQVDNMIQVSGFPPLPESELAQD